MPPHRRDTALLVQIGARLRSARTTAGWTQERLASALSMRPALVSRVENGHTGMSITTLVAAARVLGVSPADFFGTNEIIARPVEVEPELVDVYRELTTDQQALLLHVAQGIKTYG